MSKILPVVTVLSDDESRKTHFYSNLNSDETITDHLMILCRAPTQAMYNSAKVFVYDILGLFINDKKIDNYLKTRDGIIISIAAENIDQSAMTRMRNIVDNNPNTPLMIVIEKSPSVSIPVSIRPDVQAMIKSINNAHRKIFVVETGTKHEFKKFKESHCYFATLMKSSSSPSSSSSSSPSSSSSSPSSPSSSPSSSSSSSSRTTQINDMVSQFEDETLPLELWDHYGRLRIVNYSLINYGFGETVNPDGWLCTNWKKYKVSIGHGKLWNYSLTRFWANILNDIQQTFKYKSFAEMYDNHPQIQSGSYFKKFYSDVVFTPEARNTWIPPDLINKND